MTGSDETGPARKREQIVPSPKFPRELPLLLPAPGSTGTCLAIRRAGSRCRCGQPWGGAIHRRCRQAVWSRAWKRDLPPTAFTIPTSGTSVPAVCPDQTSEERVPRYARSQAARIPATLLALALVLPVPHGFTHLHLTLQPGTAAGSLEDSGPGHAGPQLTCDPAERTEGKVLAAEAEREVGNQTNETRTAPERRPRRARTTRRLRTSRRPAARAPLLRRRRARSSASRGDPDAEGPGPDAHGARAALARALPSRRQRLTRAALPALDSPPPQFAACIHPPLHSCIRRAGHLATIVTSCNRPVPVDHG